MWRLQLFWIAWIFVLTAETIPMAAQGQSYEQNALRLDTNFGDVRIVRGIEGTVVGRIGVFRGDDVTQVVAASPNAVAEAVEEVLVERLTLREALAEPRRALGELGIAALLDLGLELIDARGDLAKLAKLAFVRVEQPANEAHGTASCDR